MKGSSTINRFIYHLGFPHLWGSCWSYHIDIVSSFASGGFSRDQTDQTLLVPRKPGENLAGTRWESGENRVKTWWTPGEFTNVLKTARMCFFGVKSEGEFQHGFCQHGENMVRTWWNPKVWKPDEMRWSFSDFSKNSGDFLKISEHLVKTWWTPKTWWKPNETVTSQKRLAVSSLTHCQLYPH